MKEEIQKTLSRMQNDTPKASSPNMSNEINPVKPLGDPKCPHCGGAGYVRYEVPVGHEKFGRLETCICRIKDVAEAARARLFALSNLDNLSHLSFDNFKPDGNERANKVITPQEKLSLHAALEHARSYSNNLSGWLLLEGEYGCGKTHLAAAIANESVGRGISTLFITVPDLLDTLRFAYADPEVTFEQRFEEIRNAGLLVLDDFGTHNATRWAQEKLFQIINFRYINKLPTVITTNLMLDEIEGRIRSRLQDGEFVKYSKIIAPDYRRPSEISNPGASILSQPEIKEMTFYNFDLRENELGSVNKVVIIREKQDRFGNKYKEKEITSTKITQHDLDTLRNAHDVAASFAEHPEGWLAFLGQSFCGKTHLAAAIGNYRIGSGGQAMLLEVSSLLDYLKQTFEEESDVSFHRRLHEIRTTPLLILDDLKESSRSTNWSEDKLYSVLNYRYNNRLPVVLTTTLNIDQFAVSYPNLFSKFVHSAIGIVCEINMPAYRRFARGGKSTVKKK